MSLVEINHLKDIHSTFDDPVSVSQEESELCPKRSLSRHLSNGHMSNRQYVWSVVHLERTWGGDPYNHQFLTDRGPRGLPAQWNQLEVILSVTQKNIALPWTF